jgi:hypothetical protein
VTVVNHDGLGVNIDFGEDGLVKLAEHATGDSYRIIGALVLGGASGGLVAAGGIGLGVSGPEIVSLPYRARIDPLPTDLRTGPGKLETHIHVDLDGREVAHAVKTHASRPSRSASPGVPRRFCAGKNGSPPWWRWSVFQDPSTAWVRAVTPVAARADTPLYGATAQANEGPDLKWLDAAVASGPRTRCHGVDRNAPGRHLHDVLARRGPRVRGVVAACPACATTAPP